LEDHQLAHILATSTRVKAGSVPVIAANFARRGAVTWMLKGWNSLLQSKKYIGSNFLTLYQRKDTPLVPTHVKSGPLTSTAALYTTETRIQRIQGSHKTMPFADQPTHSANARSFRRSYIVARRSSIDFADRQPRTGRPTDRYPLNKLITFLSIRYRPTPK
jgi:hypothetical protein